MITPGLHLGYRKGKRDGVWVAHKYLDNGKYRRWKLGTADDIVDADGIHILSFSDADAKARLGPPDTSIRAVAHDNRGLTDPASDGFNSIWGVNSPAGGFAQLRLTLRGPE